MSAAVEKSVAIVGGEQQPGAYSAALREFPELRLDSVVGNAFGIESPNEATPRYRDLEAMLAERGAPDLALVMTPPGQRCEQIQQILRAGVDVLAVPPLATCAEDAESLVEFAERAGRELTTASPFRCSAGFNHARRFLREDTIGELQYVEVNLEHKIDARAGWRAEPERSGGGIWMQQGSCALDIAELLAGPLCRLRMVEIESQQNSSVEDRTVVETDHGGGVRARIRLSWNGRSRRPLALCVGTRGELAVGYSQLLLRIGDRLERHAPGHDPHDALVGSIREHLNRRCAAHPPLDQGPERLHWLEAGYRSVPGNRWVSA